MAIGCGLSVANLYYSQPLLADMARAMRVGDREMGVVSMLGQAGYALGLLLFVPVGDLTEKRSFIVGMLGAVAVACLAVTASPSYAWLAASSFILGAATIVPQLIVPFAATIAAPGERGKVVGTVMSGLLVGILSARTASGLIGHSLGWRATYGIAAVLMVGLMIAIRFTLPRSVPDHAGMSYPLLLHSMLGLIRDEPILRHSAVFGAMMFAAFSVFWTTLAFHLSRPPFEYSSDIVGLFGAIGVGGAAAAPWIGAFADRRSARWTIGLGMILTLMAFVIFGVAGRTIVGMIVGVILLDIGVQCSHVSNQTRIFALRPEARSRVNTVYMVAFFCGGSLGSLLGAQAWSLWGWPGVSACGIAFVLVALGAFWLTGRDGRRPPTEQRTT
ncbi:Inner membrane transport protein YnfM [Aquisphaera giovannonii]|uniref:Inner membrane transport protein YnfM n=1 Tax=Aquisphaera giovannonii TaxID=406548 RepID=A0A5B9VZX1_9BACT|nr:MFS transporter [Aquisphaera giovannonii]QEH33541.1 Inner membrane transport protein YnfM [Aquisphaera giovannonii]